MDQLKHAHEGLLSIPLVTQVKGLLNIEQLEELSSNFNICCHDVQTLVLGLLHITHKSLDELVLWEKLVWVLLVSRTSCCLG